jgi:hypothetical protein
MPREKNTETAPNTSEKQSSVIDLSRDDHKQAYNRGIIDCKNKLLEILVRDCFKNHPNVKSQEVVERAKYLEEISKQMLIK